MTNWTERLWVGFDTETTGLDVQSDRIVTASLVVRPQGARSLTNRKIHTWLVNPGIPIPEASIAVHGITNEIATSKGQSEHKALTEISQKIANYLKHGAVLVAFNALYDFSLLQASLVRLNLPTVPELLGGPLQPIADPLVLDRYFDKYRRGPRKLLDLAKFYGVPQIEKAHQSTDDAIGVLNILAAMVREFPQLTDHDGTSLMQLEREAHRAWAMSFNRFLESRGHKPDVALEWL